MAQDRTAREPAWTNLEPSPDDDSLRAGVAATYSVAATVSLLVLVVWGVASILRWRFVEPGGTGFLETSAQVLPVLLLTFAIERVFFERSTSQLATRASAIVAFSCVLVVTGIGEVLCLLALAWTGAPPESLRIAAGLFALAATAGSVALIVGFAAVRSGVVLDLRAGARLMLGRTSDEPDPRASSAARVTALMLAVGAFGCGCLIVLVTGVIGLALIQEDDVETAVGLLLVGFVATVALTTPSLIHLERVGTRTRARRAFWRSLSEETLRFVGDTHTAVNSLPYAPRQVFIRTFEDVVKQGKPLPMWPEAFRSACDDQRLTASERAALRELQPQLEHAIAQISSGAESPVPFGEA